MRKVSIWDVAFWIIITAIIASLVRPGSKAGDALTALTAALAAVIGEATGYAQRNV